MATTYTITTTEADYIASTDGSDVKVTVVATVSSPGNPPLQVTVFPWLSAVPVGLQNQKNFISPLLIAAYLAALPPPPPTVTSFPLGTFTFTQ